MNSEVLPVEWRTVLLGLSRLFKFDNGNDSLHS